MNKGPVKWRMIDREWRRGWLAIGRFIWFVDVGVYVTFPLFSVN